MPAGDGVVFRAADPLDAAALALLTEQLGYATSHEQMTRRLATMGGDPARLTLVAVVGEQLVGYVGVWVGQGYEADAPHARIMALVVDASWRRRGIGGRLLAAAETWSRAQGAAVIVLTSGEQRSEAHPFYERLGYANTGRRYRKELAAGRASSREGRNG